MKRNDILQQKIDAQEDEDLIVASNLFNDVLSSHGYNNISISGMPAGYSVDMAVSCTTPTDKQIIFNVELKKNNKNEYQKKVFPHSLLKVHKKELMESVTPSNYKLYYLVMENEQDAYIYNCDKIDWNTVERKWIKEKKTQFDDNSKIISVEAYRIPYGMATHYNITDYYNNFNNKKYIDNL